MAMENSGTPIRLEVKSKEEILRDKLSKMKGALVGLSVTTVAAITAAITIGLNSVKKEADNSFKDKTEEVKNESWSHTTPETTSEILDQLDKKLILGDVSDEEIERLNKMLDEDKAYQKYLEELNTNPDGGTIETGGPVIGSEEVK